LQLGAKSRILAISEMQKFIGMRIFFVDAFKSLISLEQCVACEHVDGLRVVDLQFFLDDHNKLEDRE